MKIVGTENIPRNGPVLICGNHKSFLDPPLIEVTCKRPDARFLAKKELKIEKNYIKCNGQDLFFGKTGIYSRN